jgi:hypothetical protein
LAHVLTEAIRRGLFVSAANLENRALGAISAWNRASALGAARPAGPSPEARKAAQGTFNHPKSGTTKTALQQAVDAAYAVDFPTGRGDPTEEERR